MNYDEFIKLIYDSSHEDWIREVNISFSTMNEWSFGQKPPAFTIEGHQVSGEVDFLEPNSHSTIAIYKPNIAVAMAWGADSESYQFDWVKQFPNETASIFLLDFLFHGILIKRIHIVAVDEGRYYIPAPNFAPLYITKEQYKIGKLLNDMYGNDFQRGLSLGRIAQAL